MYIWHILFIHLSADRHLDCFHLWAIVNSTTMSLGIQTPAWVPAFGHFGYIWREVKKTLRIAENGPQGGKRWSKDQDGWHGGSENRVWVYLSGVADMICWRPGCGMWEHLGPNLPKQLVNCLMSHSQFFSQLYALFIFLYFIFNDFFFYWSTVDTQCCISSRYLM